MMDRLNNLKIQKLLQEYNFLISDDSYKKEVIETYQKDFLEIINEKKRALNIAQEVKEEPTAAESNQEQATKKKGLGLDDVEEPVKNKIKRIYREIVKKTHPDKTNSEELVALYVRATEASDNYNLFELYLISANLNIPVELEDADIEVLVQLIEKKKKEVKGVEQSFIWLWVHAKSDNEREQLVDLFLSRFS
jgi:hypothetical protein